MKNVLMILFGVILLCLGGPAHAGYRVDRVVEIGPAAGPIIGTMQWSPDGTQLAYFADGYLMVSDTLGISRQVVKLEGMPRMFAWVDSNQIAINEQVVLERGGRTASLVLVDIAAGSRQEIERYRKEPGKDWRSVTRLFDGPFLTEEGRPYYYVVDGPDDHRRDESTQRWLAPPRTNNQEDRILRATDDAVYEVSGVDSVKLASLPNGLHIIDAPGISRSRKYALYKGLIVNVDTQRSLVLDSLLGERPAGTLGCGIAYSSFNPNRDEVVFQVSCNDDESYVVDRVGIYNIESGALTILDTVANLMNCGGPCYSADGSKIALRSKGKAYILYGEEM